MTKRTLVALVVGVAFTAHAQQQFPDGATTPNAAEIEKYVKDKVFNVKTASGNTWHMEYKGDGSLLVDPSIGRRYNGTWSFADGKLCDQPRGQPKSCNDVRIYQDLLYLKRESGEIIQFTP